MKLLEDRIIQDGKIINNDIIKVDSFLNHQIDVELFNQMGKDMANRFPTANKVITIETSGIAVAYAVCLALDNCKLVFAKKMASAITGSNNYYSQVKSFTKGMTFTISINKNYVGPGDKILIVDDFLAEGNAGLGLIDICRQAGAEIVGFAVSVEKGFQSGRKRIEEAGVPVYSCACIKEFKDNKPIF